MQGKKSTNIILTILAAIVLAAVGYFIFTEVSDNSSITNTPKSQASDAPLKESQGNSAPSEPNGGECPEGRPPTMLNLGGEDVRICGQQTDGTVTAVSATSLTVSTDSGSQIFSITGATKITQRGEARTTSDIKAGDRVAILPADADAQQASRILLNPSFGAR